MMKNLKANLRWIWLVTGTLAMILIFLPASLFGAEWQIYAKYAILALNALMFLLSLPCSLFAALVVMLSAYYLDNMHPFYNRSGMTLSTILLFLVGLMQWFWIARFWSPREPVMQMLNLPDAAAAATAGEAK